jgi:hypothetical protein
MNAEFSSYFTIIYLTGLIISFGICVFLNQISIPKTSWIIFVPIIVFWPLFFSIIVIAVSIILFLALVFRDVHQTPPTLPRQSL